MRSKKAPVIFYGGDYNPDQWSDATVDRDMELFRQANINLVTLPVFSWAKLEPTQGVYDFTWLDRILEKTQKAGIYVCLSTPSSTPPPWLTKQYADVLPVDANGHKRTRGMRNFYCVNSENYRRQAAQMAQKMAEHYAEYPMLAAWHVANEYGTYCYCEHCQEKFRLWAQKKYHDIANLNEKWHTSFWGKTLSSFDDIMLPTQTNDDDRFNPVLQLEYLRFMTDSTEECFLNEAQILRRYTPDIPVFSNISGFIKKLDQFKLTRTMDYAAWDNYPAPGDAPSFPAMKHEIMRAAKDGASFWLSEQSPNQQNWQPYNKLKRPGEVRLLAYQALAHGADTCLFFQMRQSVAGQEKLHGAMISHEDTADTRIFKEMAQLGAELKKLGDVFLEAVSTAQIGILFDWDNWWALELCSGPTKDMDYLRQVEAYYKMFYEQNFAADIVKFTADFTRYNVLVAPLAYMITPQLATALKAFVANGGTLITTYMTGLADVYDRCLYGARPGLLRELCGLWVEETDALMPCEGNQICPVPQQHFTKSVYQSGFLCDLLRLETALPVAVYGSDFYNGTPCVTRNAYGTGSVFYLATQPEPAFLQELAAQLCKQNDIQPVMRLPQGVEAAVRSGANGEILFVLNHNAQPMDISLGRGQFKNLLTGEMLSQNITLAARDVLVLHQAQ